MGLKIDDPPEGEPTPEQASLLAGASRDRLLREIDQIDAALAAAQAQVPALRSLLAEVRAGVGAS